MIYVRVSFLKRYNGMCLWPFLLIRHKDSLKDKRFLNHENIHAAQQKELLILPFYIWYGMDYLKQLARYRNHRTAYRNIVFEREAYTNENDPDYLKSRSWYGFKNF